MGTPSKIHVGAGNLVLNPDTTPVDLGFCSDGLTLTYSAPLEPISVDQILSPIGYFVPGEECKVETILSEITAEKLARAIGKSESATDVVVVAAGAAEKGSSTVTFGGQTVLTEYVLEYSAPKRNNRDLYIKIRLYKVNVSPEIELGFTKDNKSGIKFIAMAFADTSKAAGEQLGYFREETAEFTGDTPTLAVSATVPADAGANIVGTANLTVTFNRAIAPSSVEEGNFIVVKADGTAVTCVVTQTSSNVVTINPSSTLDASGVYILVVGKDVRALDDYTPMAANHIINFTIAS